MSNVSDLKDLWGGISDKIRSMRQLDSNFELVYGSQFHRYRIEPVVSDKEILAFERKNRITLPESYRTYLQFFGDYGASQFNGTLSFQKDVSQVDASKPSPLSIFTNVQDYTDSHAIEHNANGCVRITHGFNPSVAYLVLNGPASGHVYWLDLGEFSDWYLRWATWVLGQLKLYDRFVRFPIGSHAAELQQAFPDLVRIIRHGDDGPLFAHVGYLHCNYELDKNKRLVRLHLGSRLSDFPQ